MREPAGGPKVAFAVLGCKVNQSEAQALQDLFARHGYQVVPFEEEADVYVVHTCTVTRVAERKCRQAIRRAVRTNPRATVVVSGCYSQVAPEEVGAIPGVAVVVGAKHRSRIVELVERARAGERVALVEPWEDPEPFEELAVESPDRARAFVRVQEGCEGGCTYCIVPRARGPLRSRPPQAVLAEVERLVQAGYREIALTGVNLGAYGLDRGEPGLAGLVRDLAKIPGLGRLRLSSVEPQYFTDELVDTVTGEEKVCPHWHIPLQSGDAATLRRMGRSYSPEEYAAILERLRQRRPDAAVTTDVIVGFPGEDEAAFERSLAFVERMGFSRLHVFAYSPRPGTPAADFPDQVDRRTKEERSRRMRSLGRQLAVAFARRFVGRVLTVLVEREVEGRPGWVQGYSENYVVVRLPGGPEMVGELVPVRITGREGEKLVGERAP